VVPTEIQDLLVRREKEKELPACRGEGSVAGLQLRVRFVPAAMLSMLRTALALQPVVSRGSAGGCVPSVESQ
jgi:hypothetical protein